MLMDASDDVEADREEVATGNMIGSPSPLAGWISGDINQRLIKS